MGGIKPAAERVGRTPSAVSMALKQLEQELGGQLFEGERKAKLTRFGEFVLDNARSLIEHNERVRRTIGAFVHDGFGSIDIAVLPSIACAFLPDALRLMNEKHDAAMVRARDMDSDAIRDAVSREIIDWGIAGYSNVPHIETTPLFSEPLRVVCGADDPLCEIDGPIPWSAIANRPFIGNASCETIHTAAFLAIAKKERCHIHSVLSLLSAVRRRVGITILPDLSRVDNGEDLRFLPIDDPAARRTVYFLSRADRNLSPGARFFANILREVIARNAVKYDLELLDVEAASLLKNSASVADSRTARSGQNAAGRQGAALDHQCVAGGG